MKKQIPTINFSRLPEVINKKFYKLLFDQNRYMVLKGGGGSGKSKFAAQKIIYRMIAEKGHRFMVVRKVGDTLRDSVFADLKKVISDWNLDPLFHVPDGRNSELYIKCKLNGNEIIFNGLDKVEKRKSIEGITGIWIEEATELLDSDYRQLDIRMRGQTMKNMDGTKSYPQMIISFNPVDINHWLKHEFFGDRVPPDASTSESNYLDNPFLDDGTRKTLERFKLTDPYYYQVYCLGNWGVLGKTIFPAQIVSERIAYLKDKKPLKVGFFSYATGVDGIPVDIKWRDDENGAIRMYEDVKAKIPYVVGGDTAGEGSDYFTAHCIDNSTGKQVATLQQQYDEIDYAKQIYCLGMHYNKALVGLENNFSTYPTRKLEEWSYPRMYVRQAEDSFTHKVKQSFGFVTNKVTRMLIISNLVDIVKESAELISDIKTLEEMLTFVKNENGKPEAQEGAHDDLLMGLAITYHIRDQQQYSADNAVKFDVSKLPEDIQQDYYNASPDMKLYMAKKWGLV